jgi:4-hydroxy-tetrahydrodipicolinate synthase
LVNPRLFTAIVTPFKDNKEVDFDAAAYIAEHLIENGSEGIVVCGTTGEAPVLSVEERLELYTVIQNKVGKKAEIWAGTGSNNTEFSVELSKKAEKCGVHGIMLVSPYYNKPSQQGLYEHFKTIADSVSLPVMLYNVPGRTASNLLPQTIKKLTAVENIIAVKEASGDMDQASLLYSLVQDRMAIYCGDDSLTLPMLALGAQGVVSIASHLAGREIRRMMECYCDGEVGEARNIHNQLFPLFRGLFINSNPIPLKAAMNMLGLPAGGLRLPLVYASEEEQKTIATILRETGLLK